VRPFLTRALTVSALGLTGATWLSLSQNVAKEPVFSRIGRAMPHGSHRLALAASADQSPTASRTGDHRSTSQVSMPHGDSWFASPDLYARTRATIVNRSIRVPILMYHDITYLPHNSLGMSPHQFDAEMKYLYNHDFHTINLGQLYAALYHGYSLPSRPIVLTFDDGYESVYSNAYPILKQYGFQGTVFMISGFVGHRGRHPFLTWRELLEMERSRVIDVESHTVHHIDLATANNAQIQYELQVSAATLEHHLHHPIRYFCYPSGQFRPETLTDLRRDGYLLATTEHPGYASSSDGPYELRRLRVYEDMPLSTFAAMLQESLNPSH
jgi:peptidoglycan/xylan/chitin deacetylase (PgdA/CDA1 family)